MKRLFMKIYQTLYQAYGPRHWWPGEFPFEIMVGAILTQNTSWGNVEKAIQKLKNRKVLDPKSIHQMKASQLATLIRSSGYYRIKAKRLKAFVEFLFKEYEGNIEKMKKEKLSVLREKLLNVNGIGPETADSILLYGLNKPIFVVDAYTQRILFRHGMIKGKMSYNEIQRLFIKHLPRNERLFNEYHALFVHVGKTVCKKNPRCDICPLKSIRVA